MSHEEDLEKLVAEGRIIAGGLKRAAFHKGNWFIDSGNHVPTIDTYVASDEGPGRLLALPEHENGYFSFILELEIPKSRGCAEAKEFAHRTSVLFYEEQKNLMKRLFAKRNEYFSRHGKQISWAEDESEYWGKKAFMTLEAISHAQSKGLAQFSDPKNKELLYECLPYLFGNRIKTDIINSAGLEKERELYTKLTSQLGITPEQLTSVMQISDKCTVSANDPVLGGCYACREECH